MGYGDGFNVACDPEDFNLIYWQYQGGKFKRFYRDSREIKDIMPYTEEVTEELRFNWNAPMKFGRTSGALYVGAQYLYRSFDHGDSWERISYDLTTDNPSKQQQEETGGLTTDNSSAENHCTIYAIGESPLDEDIIWVGTDDGNLQLTTDGGKSWAELSGNIPGLPKGTWCSYTCPGEFASATAFVTFDGHRHGDMTSYVFKTTDYGKTWTSLADDNIKGYCHVIRQDLVNPDLLFLGTEFGLYISIDGGDTWARFKGKVPMVPVMEMEIHPTEHDLVLGTHGRGVLIIDDLTPIRDLKPGNLDEDLVMLGSRPLKLGYLGGEQRMEGDDEYTGYNTANAVLINYYLKKRHVFGDMYIEVYDKDGKLLETLPAGKRKGINYVTWITLMDPPKVPSSTSLLGSALTGPTLPPGDYRVKIIKGEDTYEGTVSMIWDPASRHSIEDRDLRYQKMMKAYHLLEDLGYYDAQIMDIKDKSTASKKQAAKKSTFKELDEMISRMDDMHAEIVPIKIGGITGEERLRERVANIYSGISGFGGRPTDTQVNRLAMVENEVNEMGKRVEGVISEELAEINKSLEKEGLEAISVISREEFDNMDE